MQKVRKAAALLLFAAAAMVTISGCAGNNAMNSPSSAATTAPAADTSTPQGTSTPAPTDTATPQETSTPAPTATPEPSPTPAPVTLTVFETGGPIGASTDFAGFPADDPIWTSNPMGQKILADTSVQIQWNFPSGSDGNDKLGVLLASGDYPDLIVGANDTNFNTMVSEQIAVPMDSLITQYGPDITTAYGSALDLLRSSDGHIYSLSFGYGNIPSGTNPPGFGSGFMLRNDVWQSIGSPKLNTLDDIYNALAAIKQKNPTNYQGDPTYPLGGFKQTWQNTLQTLLAAGGIEDYWYINNGQLQYWTRAPYALSIVEFYNKVYREGLLDPDSLTIDRGTWSGTKMETAIDLSFFGGWWMNWTIGNDYRAAGIPNAENMDMLPFAFSVPGGQTPKLTPINPMGTRSTVITNACKNPDAAMKFLNYLAKPDINFQVQNGVEGVMWTMNNNVPAMVDSFKQRWLNGESDEKFSAETGNRLYNYFCSTDVGRSPWGTYWILKDDPVVMGDTRAAQRDAALGPYWYDAYPTGGLMNGAPEDIGMIDTAVLDRFNNEFYTCVTAKSQDDCDAAYAAYCADLESLGLVKYEQYANTVYQARLQQEKQQ